MWFEPGEQIDDVLWHGSGTTGVTGWTIKVLKDGELRSDITATVTEIGTGFYRVSFTPQEEGYWVVNIYETAAASVHYSMKYLVKSLTDLIGGEGYDRRRHSLSRIRSALQTATDRSVGVLKR